MNHATRALLTLAVTGLATNQAHAIALGQVDDFEDGTTQNWVSGNPNPNPPINVADAGAAGVGDDVLQVTANGASGVAGSNLVTFNTGQWLGDYNAAGVTAIRFDANNVGSSNVSLGFSINNNALLTADTGTIASGSGWNTYEIQLDTPLLGSTTNLDNVADIRLRWMAAGSFLGGAPAQVHIDNITAVPEPASLALVSLGGLMLGRRRH